MVNGIDKLRQRYMDNSPCVDSARNEPPPPKRYLIADEDRKTLISIRDYWKDYLITDYFKKALPDGALSAMEGGVLTVGPDHLAGESPGVIARPISKTGQERLFRYQEGY
jgi:hypothetical protein